MKRRTISFSPGWKGGNGIYFFIIFLFMMNFTINNRWRFVLLIVGYMFGVYTAIAQQRVVVPKQEIRAVWITTVLGLDWPKSKKIEEQKRSLLEMIEKSAAAKFNTIYFQIRGRSDALYRSRYEPWSHILTGELGKNPGWDPLEFVLIEAHKRDMEVHAWFNTFLVKSGKEKPKETLPRHLILAHPEWLQLVKGEWWLDPGIPAGREYTINVAMDIVRNYDIDGFHFDFLRYPPNGFPDDATWKKYGAKQPKENWRRENLNSFVRAFYDSARALKPMLKIGATPIGIYNASVFKKGMKGFEDVYQDAKTWLKEGTMDYITPQVYWSLKNDTSGPDFALVTKDWLQSSAGRQITIGIGIYKPDVYRQIPQLIDTLRALGAAGQAYFRYEHTQNFFDLTTIYHTPALIPPMKWKDSIPPNEPVAFEVIKNKAGVAELSWRTPLNATDGDSVKYVNIYRAEHFPVDIQDPFHYIGRVSSRVNSFIDSVKNGNDSRYYYAVASMDKGNNESHPVQESPVHVPEVISALNIFQPQWKLGSIVIDNSEELTIIPYEIKEASLITLSIMDQSKAKTIWSQTENRLAGKNISTVDISMMEPGSYIVELKTLQFTSQKTFLIED